MSVMSLTELRDRVLARHAEELAAVQRCVLLEQMMTNGESRRDLEIEQEGTERTERRGKQATKAARMGRPKGAEGIDPRSVALLKAGLKLPARFTFTDGVRIGVKSSIYRWLKKGWIRAVGKGQYERTANYPTVAAANSGRAQGPATSEVSAGTNTQVKADLERALERACQERDDARGAGRTTMEGIAQRRVDELEAQLENL